MSISGNTSCCNKETVIQKLKYSLEHNILKIENKLYTTKVQEDLKNIERVIKKYILYLTDYSWNIYPLIIHTLLLV